jgi:DNA replication protein DnaC
MFPTLATSDLSKLVSYQNFDVFLYEPGITTSACLNCSGEKVVTFTICEKKSSNQPLFFEPCKYYSDGWHKIFETLVFPCPVCTDADAYRERLKRLLFERSGLLPEERDWKISYISDIPGKQAALEYANKILSAMPTPGDLYLLYGEPGMGKTGILKSLVAQYIAANVPAKYMTAAAVLRTIKSTYTQSSEISEEEAIENLDSFPLLCIDEVDVIGNSDWSQSSLREVIDRRYAQRFNKATIFASNAHPNQLWSYFSSRLDDGYKIPVTGKSLRGHGS